MYKANKYKEIWFVDFEYTQDKGAPPKAVCLVAKEYYTGQIVRRPIIRETDDKGTCQGPGPS